MFEGVFGNATAEKMLLYMEQYSEAYPTALANTFENVTVSMAQRQLERFEGAGVLHSQTKGRTRLYTWNHRYPFLTELRNFLRKGLEALPEKERQQYFMARRRPRRKGKPL